MGLSYTFIAGAYRPTIGAVSLGQIEDGFNFEYTFTGEPIRGQNLGDSVQDIVYRGGDCFIQFTAIEFSQAGLLSLLWPWHATMGQVGVVGILANNNKADVLVLTRVAGTPAYYATITAEEAILAPGYPVQWLLAPRLKKIPVRLQLLPYGALDAEVWFVASTI